MQMLGSTQNAAPTRRACSATQHAWLRRWSGRALMLASAALLAQALWVPVKAELAQWLLEWRWAQARADGVSRPPWPWADTHAVARLTRGIDGRSQIVLAGDNGRALAFGPGWNEASAVPTARGTVVISAHRDTHFAWLRDIEDGEEVELEGMRAHRRYRLHSRSVIDVRQQALALDHGEDQLLLITCWPFDAVDAGGPLRLVLRFVPDAAASGRLTETAAVFPSRPHTPASPRNGGAGTDSSHRG